MEVLLYVPVGIRLVVIGNSNGDSGHCDENVIV
jgi:hypothetical protein